MGFGDYSVEAHETIVRARAAQPRADVFGRTECDPAMRPLGVGRRESRDSARHPESTGIVFALDVSGSMGDIPHALATKTLPAFMRSVEAVLPHPQVMFLAFGNVFSDVSPLQVGQFESEAGLMDRWLASIHLEGGGGALGESYDLAMYFAARHTAIDGWEKRKKKSYFFMTGDEVPFIELDAAKVREVLGDRLQQNIPVNELVAELISSFHVFFLVPDARRAATENCGAVWRALLHERCVVLDRPDDTAVACAMLVGIQEGVLTDAAAIGARLEALGWTGEARDRVVAAVLPFAQALPRGIAAPEALVRRTEPSSVSG